MTTTDIRKAIEEIGYTITSNWRKDYGDGRVLSEYKILKSAKSRKPLAFVQAGYYTANQEIIGLSVTLVSNMSNCIDCDTIQDLETCLKQFDENQRKIIIFN
jgi:hypothetical protein